MISKIALYKGFCFERTRRKGSIEPGKLADMVILSEDPYSVNPKDIKDIEVEMTIVGGRVAWAKE